MVSIHAPAWGATMSGTKNIMEEVNNGC